VTSIYGKDINTDDIIPASFLQQSNDRKFFKDYAFDRYDPAFRERCKETTTNIVIGGENFACGSSREQAVYAIQENDVVCVIAQSSLTRQVFRWATNCVLIWTPSRLRTSPKAPHSDSR
jgi:3-isopropylmalate dehydratase small subunit